MTKEKQIKLLNKLAEKLIKQVRLNLGIKALTKNEKVDMMADFIVTIHDCLDQAGVFNGEK